MECGLAWYIVLSTTIRVITVVENLAMAQAFKLHAKVTRGLTQ